MTNQLLFELMGTQLGVLKQFLRVLTEERDAIISFSLEGIVRANNVKEELLKKLEFLEKEQERMTIEHTPIDAPSKEWTVLRKDFEQTLKEVKVALEKNMRLLTFSMDHVKCSIEKMISFINRSSYGRRREALSFVLSKEV
ncbi:MAG TPA: flagellar export chaperone FlgN [Syntrophorhabdales bacterium]|nr:flagellar export chaperone FlgN [Syntrophorhabdales bacterium]